MPIGAIIADSRRLITNARFAKAAKRAPGDTPKGCGNCDSFRLGRLLRVCSWGNMGVGV